MRKPTRHLLAGAVVLAAMTTPAEARTWRVPAEVPTIAAAIDSAAAGDVVELAAGVYRESGLGLKSDLTIRAADPAAGAAIDAGGADRIFAFAGLLQDVALIDLTLTGGASYNGAAARFSSCQGVVFRGCTFEANRADMGIGGALHVTDDSSILIEECLFLDNSAAWDDGGAIWLECPVAEIIRCTFTGNDAVNGGAISCRGQDVRITACVFTANSAGNGAGIDLRGDTVVVTDCLFAGNTATRGGAAGCWYGATPRFVGCTLVENTASDQGGALYCTSGAVASVERSLLAYNAGGGAVACVHEGSASLQCSNVYGNAGGDWTGCLAGQEGLDGNIGLDPLFCPSAGGATWEVSASSPCLPANNPCGELVGAFGQGCGVSGVPVAAPSSAFLRLLGNHPNPFNPSTTISFSLAGPARVDLQVYDLAGRLVAVVLADEPAQPGRHDVIWNGRDRAGRRLPSGSYIYRLEAGGYAKSQEMTLVK